MPEEIIPLAAVILMFGLPIVAILTSHQRKMAELMRQPQQQQGTPHGLPNLEIQALRAEVRELKQMVADQTLALDSLRTGQPMQSVSAVPPPAPIHEQLRQS